MDTLVFHLAMYLYRKYIFVILVNRGMITRTRKSDRKIKLSN